MQIFVRDHTGRTLAIHAERQSKISEIKNCVTKKNGVPQGEIILSYAGKTLHGNESLADCNVQRESTKFMAPGLDGGENKAIKRNKRSEPEKGKSNKGEMPKTVREASNAKGYSKRGLSESSWGARAQMLTTFKLINK